MASGCRRLGAFLSEIEDVLAVLRVLDTTAAPRGREFAAAQALCELCRSHWPRIAWQVQRVGAHGANLVASHGPGPLLYSHLDTSVDGDAGQLRVTFDSVEGFGLAVARGPAAAALVAFATATSGTLLLASSGTHRRGAEAAGVDAWLAANSQPRSAIVAKCGPPGVLWSEPGALYLTVSVTGRAGAVMTPASAVPAGGLPARLGVVLDVLASWCSDYVAGRPGVGQLGAAAGIGAVDAGLPDKADLFPASARIGLYVVTLPGSSTASLVAEVSARVRAVLVGDLAGCTVDVTADPVHDAAATPPDAAIVTAAIAAWTASFGAPAEVTGWTGSTDGVLLRARGIDTVRLGPQPTLAPDDPRREVLRIDQLAAFVAIYRELLSTR
ncbi:MAG: hypothetical protein ACRDVG_16365 [Jatrophihabitantaceae bacterium]